MFDCRSAPMSAAGPIFLLMAVTDFGDSFGVYLYFRILVPPSYGRYIASGALSGTKVVPVWAWPIVG